MWNARLFIELILFQLALLSLASILSIIWRAHNPGSQPGRVGGIPFKANPESPITSGLRATSVKVRVPDLYTL